MWTMWYGTGGSTATLQWLPDGAGPKENGGPPPNPDLAASSRCGVFVASAVQCSRAAHNGEPLEQSHPAPDPRSPVNVRRDGKKRRGIQALGD